jgi:hypothetical protein
VTKRRICPCCGGPKNFYARRCRSCSEPVRPWAGVFTSPEVLFWSKVEKTAGCWVWLGAIDRDGYGKFQVTTPGEKAKQRHVRAHRYAWEIATGTHPSGLLLHDCDNPACVRIGSGHVKAGTQRENIRDCVARGRHARHGHVGSVHPKARLDESRVRTIRAVFATRGVQTSAASAVRSLAAQYQVSISTMWSVVLRRSWRHVP